MIRAIKNFTLFYVFSYFIMNFISSKSRVLNKTLTQRLLLVIEKDLTKTAVL